MYNHAPEKYKCPICLAIQGVENKETMILESDIIYRDSMIMVFIASIFNKTNPGHIIVVPNNHYENLYDMPDEIVSRISVVSKQFAIVLKNVRSGMSYCNANNIKELQKNAEFVKITDAGMRESKSHNVDEI